MLPMMNSERPGPSKERHNNKTLQALLEKCSDLNLEGKVRITDTQNGHGGCSDIFLGWYTTTYGAEYRVAVKKLRVHIMRDRKFEKRAAKELYIWSKLDHPRILPLEGFYIDDAGYPHLISRWMENGTIMDYLKAFPTADMLSLVIGIAEGLDYLHSKDVFHSDIKPGNILISGIGEPLLCDFGVSRMLEASSSFQLSPSLTSGLRGTIRYMSKEILRLENEEAPAYSKGSDVWAFGMTVFNMLTSRVPYHNITNHAAVIFAVVTGTLPSWPEEAGEWPIQNQVLASVCEICWEECPMRPSMDKLLGELRNLKYELLSLGDTDNKFPRGFVSPSRISISTSATAPQAPPDLTPLSSNSSKKS